MEVSFVIKKTLTVIACLLLTVSCTRQPQKPLPRDNTSLYGAERVENVKVITEDCKIRSGAGSDFDVIGSLNKGDKVDVVGQLKDWYIIRMPNNQVGAVDSNEVTPVIEESTQSQTKGAVRLTSNEQKIVNLINQERTSRNLQPLSIDLDVTKVARVKAQDMIDNNYFSHYSPTYGSPFDMLKSFGINFLHAGENLAGNSSIDNAHQSLMNSQGHRENILNPNFTHIGVGIKNSNKYGNMIVQMFVSKPK